MSIENIKLIAGETWQFTCERDCITYSGVLDLTKLDETSFERQFLQLCPGDVETNFNNKNYDTAVVGDNILLKLIIKHINKSVTVLLTPKENNDTDVKFKRVQKHLSDLSKIVRFQAGRNDDLKSQVDDLLNPKTGYVHYVNSEQFRIKDDELINFAICHVPEYSEFRKNQVNASEQDVLNKYGNKFNLRLKYMARVRNLSLVYASNNHHQNHAQILDANLLFAPGCWETTIVPYSDIKSTTRVIDYHIHNSPNYALVANVLDPLSEKMKKDLNLS